MIFSQRPGKQRPGSSYAFSHEKGFAELIMSGRMTSQRRKGKRPHVVGHLVAGTIGGQNEDIPLPRRGAPAVTFENELCRDEIESDAKNPAYLTNSAVFDQKSSRSNSIVVDSIVGMESTPTKEERLVE